MSRSAHALLDRLLTVEVDVIVTHEVPDGAPVLDDRAAAVAALIDEYRRWILERAPGLDEDWATLLSSGDVQLVTSAAGERAGLVEDGRPISGLHVDRLGADRPARPVDQLVELERTADVGVAMCAVLAATGRLSDAHLATVFRRIAGNAAQLRAVPHDGPLAPDELAVLRKAVELRTDVILAQTVVQADGDVVARVDPSVVTGEMGAVAGIADVAMERTVRYWSGLVDLIGVVATTAGALRATFGRVATRVRSGLRRWRSQQAAGTASAGARLGLRRTWMQLREAGADLFGRGGAAIESCEPGGDPYARTLIQPDGDALWLVRHDALARQDLIDEHIARVTEWYGRTGSAVASARAYITGLQGLASAGIGVAGATVSAAAIGWWALALGSAAAAAAPRFVRAAVGSLIRRRCNIQAW